jgi:hypothetical protein
MSNAKYADGDAEPISFTPWPDPPGPEAYYGLLGQTVNAIAPHTEADPLAILANLVVFFGSAVGRTAYVQVEATRHYMNEFAVTVGKSALSRKGTASDWGLWVLNLIDPDWVHNRVLSGLSSGEGLISAVADPVEKREPVRQKGRVVDWQNIVVPGVSDKRLLVLESEFGGVLKVLEREGNKLSALIRQAWDGGVLRTMTKLPHVATDAHISILGHITLIELRSRLSVVDMINCFANRFLWFAVRRVRSQPFGGGPANVTSACLELSLAVEKARTVSRIAWTNDAKQLWPPMYEELGNLPAGTLGEVLSRCHPHVLRLAAIYALADKQDTIDVPHLEAAKALWDASVRCARFIFGSSVGDPLADKILCELKRIAPDGLTKSEISRLFQHNQSSQRIVQAIALLLAESLVREVKETQTGGRPAHRYFAGGISKRTN